jgi:hypothetical protein
MIPIDIANIADRLATEREPALAGTTTYTGGRLLAQRIEHLIDDAAVAGAFADLADRPSIEVTDLTGAGSVWLCLEFDRDHRLLRAGPVPIGELAPAGVADAGDIAAVLVRVRRLMSIAVLLDTQAVRPDQQVGVRARIPRTGPLRLSITGTALDETVMDAIRVTCLDAYEQPTGDSMSLGAALATVRDNRLTKAQAYGSDPVPARIEALWQHAEQAELDIVAQHLPASLDLPIYAAGNLVRGLVDALADPMAGPTAQVEGPVTVACRKRREACAELVTSSGHAQHFIFERAAEMPHPDAVQTCVWIDAIHADAVRVAGTALLLSHLAVTAEQHDEPRTARALDAEADRHAHKIERIVANAWFVATEALQTVTPSGSRGNVVDKCERRTGWVFVRGQDHVL